MLILLRHFLIRKAAAVKLVPKDPSDKINVDGEVLDGGLCVCASERERERQRDRETERQRETVRERAIVCVCVREREREREIERDTQRDFLSVRLAQLQFFCFLFFPLFFLRQRH